MRWSSPSPEALARTLGQVVCERLEYPLLAPVTTAGTVRDWQVSEACLVDAVERAIYQVGEARRVAQLRTPVIPGRPGRFRR